MDQYMHMHTVTRHGLHDIHGQLEKIRKVSRNGAGLVGGAWSL